MLSAASEARRARTAARRSRRRSAAVIAAALLASLVASPAQAVAPDAVVPRADDEPLSVTVVVPLTAPPTAAALLSRDTLTELTAPTGALTAQLDALADESVVIAVDPRIVASIEALGTSAPENATAWLERLASARADVIPLTWADSDVGYYAAEVRALPEPAGFSFVAERTDGEVTDPLDFRWSVDDVLWPRTGTVSTRLMRVAAEADATVLLRTDELRNTVDGTVGTFEDEDVLLAAATESDLFGDAVAGVTASQRAAARQDLREALAERASTGEDGILIALDRSASYDATALASAVDAIEALQSARPAGIREALSAASGGRVLLKPSVLLDDRRALVAATVAGEQSVAAEARALVEPELVTDEERLRTLGILGNGWVDDAGWPQALANHETHVEDYSDAVTVDRASDVLQISSAANLPVAVSNTFPYPVEVLVVARPTTDRVQVESPVALQIDGDSRSTAQVPVQAIANGTVTVTVRVTTADGDALGGVRSVRIDIQAGWEAAGAGILIGAVVLLFGFGLVRSLRKRRRAARAAAQGDDR